MWCKFFKDEVQVEIPEIQNPGIDDLYIIFKMNSVEDKQKLFKYIKTNKFEGVKFRAKVLLIYLRISVFM